MKTKVVNVEARRLRNPVVREALEWQNLHIVSSSSESPLAWFDGSISMDEMLSIKLDQKANKIPGMDVICYKSTLFQSLNQMQTLFPNYYNFFPRTFLLPHQYSEFLKEHKKMCVRSKDPTWIIKPRNGCCGSGIRLTQNPYELSHDSTQSIIQAYIPPLLVDSHKFDFRLYLLISDLQPFTAYIYKDGLARFCTSKYKNPNRSNLNDKFMHLSNTAINSENRAVKDFEYTRLASSVFQELIETQPLGEELWIKVQKVCILTLLAIYPQIISSVNGYHIKKRAGDPKDMLHKFFHIIGIDIMINERCDPVVLEINDNPSMKSGVAFETELKKFLISDALKIVSIPGFKPQDIKENGWKRLLPLDDETHFAHAVHTIQQRALNVFGPKTPVPPLSSQQAVRSIIYPKINFDKTKIKRPLYKYSFQ